MRRYGVYINEQAKLPEFRRDNGRFFALLVMRVVSGPVGREKFGSGDSFSGVSQAGRGLSAVAVGL